MVTDGLYWERHCGNGPTVLFVHGLLLSIEQWLPSLPRFKEFCSPLFVELLGHSRSTSPARPSSYYPEKYVEAFESIRTEAAIPEWFVCGFSMGTALTARYAILCPEQIRGHIFTNSYVAFADSNETPELQRLAICHADAIETHGTSAIDALAMHPKNMRHVPRHLHERLIAGVRSHDTQGIANTWRHTIPRLSVRRDMLSNKVPSLLIHGVRERRFAAHGEYLKTHMPRLEVIELHVGHGVSMEAPEEFSAALEQFILRNR